MQHRLQDIQAMKQHGHRIAMLTAYDYPSAILAARAGIDIILVGDSVGMVVQGHRTTIPVSLDAMIYHSAAVARGAAGAFIVGDLPFLTYASLEDAVLSARRLMQEGGVHAVKLEGGHSISPTVQHLTTLGVPVMGHIGYTPQSEFQSGVRVRGKRADEATRLLQDARALEAAGAFALVLELVPAPLAEAITKQLTIPTIGIGAGPGCDGQVQVWHDVLGLSTGATPRHAARYADIGTAIGAALTAYVTDVRAGNFPGAQHSSTMDQSELVAALEQIGHLP